jgi:hypothetical protein
MRWYARPDGGSLQLGIPPQLASWNKADEAEQKQLRLFLDETEALLATSQIEGIWALRLDVGRPRARDLLNGADLDNYLKPLVSRLSDAALVSVWCTKQYSEQSFVRVGAAHEMLSRPTSLIVARPTASYENVAYKEQVQSAVAHCTELPAGPVRLELAFLIGPNRRWWHLWKPTIDALEPLLGRDPWETRLWHPRDGRITELGMHLTVDPSLRHEVLIGIEAQPVHPGGP